MSSIGVIKAQLFHLEKKAQRLEAIVLKELYWLEYLDGDEAGRLEVRVLRKLRRLDDIQDEIDLIIGNLKDAGEFDHLLYVQTLRPSNEKKPVPSTKTAGLSKKTIQLAEWWGQASCFMDEGNGLITSADLRKITGLSNTSASQIFKQWSNAKMIEFSGYDGKTKTYRRLIAHT